MPQFDFSQALPQVIWLALVFGILYLAVHALYPRVGRVNAKGQFTIVREATRSVHPDPYLVTHSLGDWTATLSSLDI